VTDIQIKPVAELRIGEWAQVNGQWTKVQGCVTDRDGWTHLDLSGWLVPDLPMHHKVEVPWSATPPEESS
jgi:hypothetical protein